MMHINGYNSNTHLQRAIKKYGLEAFEFIVVEFVEGTSLLTPREQLHLDWLFSLASELRYNICPTAESRLGTTHTAETKAKMSARKSGENHPMYGKTLSAESIDLNRLNQPSRISVFVYEQETRKLVKEFPSQVTAAIFLKVSRYTVQYYLATGKVLNNKYIIRSSTLS
jgi:hypothetical protein